MLRVEINEQYVFLGVRLHCKVGRAGFKRLTEGGLSSSESSSFFSDRWHLGEKSVPWR